MKNVLRTTVALTAAMIVSLSPVHAENRQNVLPTATEGLVNVLNIGNTSDGSEGRLTIGSYTARLFNSSAQSTVDAADSAAYIPYGTSKVFIADHASQGFNIIKSVGIGTTATITDNSSVTNLTLVSRYQGTNTGNGINLSNGTYAENVKDGKYVMYTCNDSTGVSVTVTYWSEGATTQYVAQAAAAGGIPMYRMYNPYSGEHFYTASAGERDYLASLGWHYEGVGWTAPSYSNHPVYRLYNPNSGDHHYTLDAGERNWLTTLGWRYEGVGWYSDDQQRVPLYRQFNPNVTIGTHNYTASSSEKYFLISIGWRDESVGWYGM